MNSGFRRFWVVFFSFAITVALAIGLINLLGEYFLKIPSPYRIVLFTGMVIALFSLVLGGGNATWKRFLTLPMLPRRVWAGITLVMALGWIFTPFETLFPRWLPLLIPTSIPRVVAGVLILDICLLFFAGGVWLITLFNYANHRSFNLEKISKRISPLHVGLLFVVYILFSLLVTGSGVFHPEMYLRLPAHISGKPILDIIFDAKAMNMGGWEARQLSFLFDVIDGNFVAWCIRMGIPNFRSLTQYVFTLIIVGYLWGSFTKDMKADRLFSLLMIALLLTTPSFVYNDYYRTSKIGVTLMMVILLTELYKVLTKMVHPEARLRKPALLLLLFFLAALALTLFDVLGVLLAGILTGYCFVIYCFRPDKYKAAMVGGLVLALIAWAVYFLWLGPALTLTFSGVPIDSSFLTQASLINLLPYMKWEIPLLLVDMLRTLLGNITQLQAFFVILTLGAAALWLGMAPRKVKPDSLLSGNSRPEPDENNQGSSERDKYGAARAEPFFSLLALLGGISVVYDFLITRWPPILWSDVRIGYYIEPAQAILLFGVATFLARPRLQKKILDSNLYPLVILMMLFFLVGNTIGVIRIKSIIENGSLADAYRYAPLLLDGLRHINSPNYIPDTAVLTDPIYRLFLKLKPFHP